MLVTDDIEIKPTSDIFDFTFERLEGGIIHGYYDDGGERVEHRRTCGHVRVKKPVKKRKNKRKKRRRKSNPNKRQRKLKRLERKRKKADNISPATHELGERTDPLDPEYPAEEYNDAPSIRRSKRNEKTTNNLAALSKDFVEELDEKCVTYNHDVIYRVRGWRNTRSNWSYEGKSYAHRYTEWLTAEWLNDNTMTAKWRAATIHRKRKHWFEVPIMADKKQEPRIANVDDGDVDNLVRFDDVFDDVALHLGDELHDQAGLTSGASCAAGCLLKFYEYAGLTQAKLLSRWASASRPQFGKCVAWVRGHKGFTQSKPEADTFNILTVDPTSMFFVQICAVHQQKSQSFDNTHSICVFNNLIFDFNMEDSLQLNKSNLDACCVGGSCWVYHHSSRVVCFTPKKTLSRYISGKICRYVS